MNEGVPMSYSNQLQNLQTNLSPAELVEIQRVGKYYKEIAQQITKADLEAEKKGTIETLELQPLSIQEISRCLEAGGPELEQVVNQMDQILSEKGFFTICDHGVSQDLIDRMIKHSRWFFSLSAEEKAKYIISSSTIRGWTNPSRTRYSFDESKVVEVYKEAFHFG